MNIGVTGCLPNLPNTFPLEYAENAGNMIHANAPFEMFDSCIYSNDRAVTAVGSASFAEFVNTNCSHLIITLANTLRLGKEDGSNFERLHRFIEKIKKPIVVFGLGVQSSSDEIADATLPKEAIEFVQYLSTRTEVIGVRGETTRLVLEKLCGVKNVFVTGCPSLFSRPEALHRLSHNLLSRTGRIAYSGTRYFEEREGVMLYKAIKNDLFIVEPVNKHHHAFYNAIQSNQYSPTIFPYFLKKFLKTSNEMLTEEEVIRQYSARYRLFRNVNDWKAFNQDLVSFTYGTRFHVNMASLISGKPALWITHDARTRELTKFLHLPSLPLDEAYNMEPGEIFSRLNYDDFFNNIVRLFNNFNHYLALVGLPKINLGSLRI